MREGSSWGLPVLTHLLSTFAEFRPFRLLLYVSPAQGWMGFPSLYDYVQKRKWVRVHETRSTDVH